MQIIANKLNRQRTTWVIFLILFTFLNATGVHAQSDQVSEYLRLTLENITTANVLEDEKIHCTNSLPKIYLNNEFSQNFNSKGEASIVLSFLEKSELEGLNPEDYHTDQIQTLLKKYESADQITKAHLDLLLTDGALLFISHMISGKVLPNKRDPEWHVQVTEQGMDPIEIFQKLQKHPANAIEVLKNLAPKHNVYQGLKASLKEYRKIRENGGWKPITFTQTIKPGSEDPALAAVRARLKVTGEYQKEIPDKENMYEDELKEAVITFQQRHGLDDDGSIGPKTQKALNVTVDERIEQIMVNMERWRWLPREFGAYYVKVNIANFTLDVMKNGALVRHHKVVIGKPVRKTPVFAATMKYLVINPTWTVPPGILREDIIPDMKNGINTIAKKKITITDKNGNVVAPSSINWHGSGLYTYNYVQPAGRDNALGAVKFMFPNPFSVYLHDTPSKELFQRSERAFSSGCVRVENPLELAEFLLGNAEKYSLSKLKEMVAASKTQTILLKEKPEVYILYWTSWTNDSGQVQFRNDLYERDKVVAEALLEKE